MSCWVALEQHYMIQSISCSVFFLQHFPIFLFGNKTPRQTHKCTAEWQAGLLFLAIRQAIRNPMNAFSSDCIKRE